MTSSSASRGGRDAMSGDLNSEIRRALALTCKDAITCTEGTWTPEQRDTLLAVLDRLISIRPVTAEEEGQLIHGLLDAGWELTLPFDQTIVGKVSS